MKTLLDIPELLYKRAEIQAKETGVAINELLLNSLEKGLAIAAAPSGFTNWANRELLPEYESALKAGAFSRGTDSSEIISDERTSRENALL
jgi:hypothetical protein